MHGLYHDGVKLDAAMRDRLKDVAQRIDRTSRWFIKQAIFSYLERLENDMNAPEILQLTVSGQIEAEEIMPQSREGVALMCPAVPISPTGNKRLADRLSGMRRFFINGLIPDKMNRWGTSCDITL